MLISAHIVNALVEFTLKFQHVCFGDFDHMAISTSSIKSIFVYGLSLRNFGISRRW